MLKVQEGDLDKLGLLFERYKKVLFGFFFNMNHDMSLSEDLVQNVFVRILKYKHGFKATGEFKVWMFHIARNVNIDNYRKNKFKHSDSLELWEDQVLDEAGNQEMEMTKIDEMSLLEKALIHMEAEKREVITLSKIDGLKYKQIGELLNCSEGAVKVKVFRALQDLKEKYMLLEQRL